MNTGVRRGPGALAAVGLLVALLLPGASPALAGTPGDPDGDRLPTTFEMDRSHTDPDRADTDGDGIRDGAEDPDGDGLSNAGERRYHTDPLKRNSDGVGPDDWHRDSNRDGVPDGRTQDRGRVPTNLRPSLAGALKDRPVTYTDGCHLRKSTTPRRCFYGDTGSDTTVVLFGDSHAAEWLPALIELGERRGWRILPITKSACPAPAAMTDPGYPDACGIWRTKALKLIAQVHPQLVLTAGFGGYSLFQGTRRVSSARRMAVWQAGWESTLKKLKARAGTVVLLGDSPLRRDDAAPCLRKNPTNVAACATPRSVAIMGDVRGAERRAARAQHVPLLVTSYLVCPYDPCPVLVDRFLIQLDRSHLTATYSTMLAGGLEQKLPGRWGPAASGGAVAEAMRTSAAPVSLLEEPVIEDLPTPAWADAPFVRAHAPV